MNGALPWRNLGRADMILRADARMRIGPTRRSVLALIGSFAPAAAFAAYPERPIKLVVALAPGGPADIAARLFAPYFSERLGQSVVIENRTGASSVVGTESVVRAPPDGYTLLFGSSSSFAVNPAVMKNLRFDVRTDLRLVGLVSYTPHVLVVRAALAANTLAELIALAQDAAGQAHLRVVGRGRRHPSRERAVQARGRRRYRPRPLSRRWTRGDGLAHRRRRHFHQ